MSVNASLLAHACNRILSAPRWCLLGYEITKTSDDPASQLCALPAPPPDLGGLRCEGEPRFGMSYSGYWHGQTKLSMGSCPAGFQAAIQSLVDSRAWHWHSQEQQPLLPAELGILVLNELIFTYTTLLETWVRGWMFGTASLKVEQQMRSPCWNERTVSFHPGRLTLLLSSL